MPQFCIEQRILLGRKLVKFCQFLFGSCEMQFLGNLGSLLYQFLSGKSGFFADKWGMMKFGKLVNASNRSILENSEKRCRVGTIIKVK